MAKPTLPRKILPPVRVEEALHKALSQLAQEEGRTITDVIRALLRVAVKEARQ